MYQFQVSNQADVIMPLDLSAVFFVLIEQCITHQKGLYQGVIPASVLGEIIPKINAYLSMLAQYHVFLKTDAGREYSELRPLYFDDDRLLHLIPDDIKPFLEQVKIYQNTLTRDFADFYKFNHSPEALLLFSELKKRLFPIMDILKNAHENHESVMFQKL